MRDQDRISVFLSYLGFVGLLPPYIAYFFFAKTSYARFHARQGIYLTLAFLVGAVFLGVIRLLAIWQDWSLQFIYASYGGLFFLYICLNLYAAISGLLGRKSTISLFKPWLKDN